MGDNGWFVTSVMYIEMFISTIYWQLHRRHYAMKFTIAVLLFAACYTQVQQAGAQNTVLLGVIAFGALIYAVEIGVRHLFASFNYLRSLEPEAAGRKARDDRNDWLKA